MGLGARSRKHGAWSFAQLAYASDAALHDGDALFDFLGGALLTVVNSLTPSPK